MSTAFSSIGMVPIQVWQENVGLIFINLWKKLEGVARGLVASRVATPVNIDRLWMRAFKTKIGPFGIMGMAGLDVLRDIETQYAKMDGQEYSPPPMFLEEMMSESRLEVKTDNVFYTYPALAYVQPGSLEHAQQTGAESVSPQRDTRVETWKLVSRSAKIVGEEQVPSRRGREAQGQLMCGADGTMSVYVTKPNQTTYASSDPLMVSHSKRAAVFLEFATCCGRFPYGHGIVYQDEGFCSFPHWQGS